MGRLYIEPTNGQQTSESLEQIISAVEPVASVEMQAPVEMIKEVIKEVPVEVIKEIEVIKEVPVEIIREVVKEVPVEIIKEVPVEVVREVEVIKEVPVEKIIKIEDMEKLRALRFELEEAKRKNKMLSIGLVIFILLTMILGAINV